MGVRWQITFETDKHHTGIVKVYDSSYSGDPIDIEPAVDTFYTSRQMQEMSQPVVSESGYLRVIDNDIASEHIEDMHPVGALDRPVEFYLDGVLKWRGYISPETFTVDWEPAPREVAFPLVGALSALDSVTIEKNLTNRQSIAAFLYEILEATGFTWSKIVMVTQMESLNDGTTYDVPELRLQLSRYNFMAGTGADNIDDVDWTPIAGDSYLKILQDICTYFCWTAIQEGDVLYLSSLRTDLTSYPKSVTWAALEALAEDPTDSPEGISDESSRPLVAFSGINLDGVNHRKSIKNGARKITIESNLNNRDDIVPRIGYKGRVLTDWLEDIWELPDSKFIGHCLFLDPSKEPTVLFMYGEEYYEFDSQWLPVQVDWQVPTEEYNPPCGAIVKGFTFAYDPTETPDPNPVTIYRNMLRLRRGGLEHVVIGSSHVLASIRSVAAGFFPAGGALFINGNVFNSAPDDRPDFPAGDAEGLTQVGPFLNNLYLRIRLGDKYFNGTSWQSVPATFPVEVIAVNEPASLWSGGPGKIKNTSPGGYDGIEGYCIPIEENMEGLLVIDFFSWENKPDQTGSDRINTIFIDSLDIRYVNEFISDETHGVRLTAMTGTPFKDNKDVTLNLTSCIGVKQGQSLLFWDGAPIGDRELFEYAENVGEQAASQPEYWLLDSLLKAYSQPSVWLELEASLDSALLMWSLIGLNSKKYLITTLETNYASEHTKMIIASYE